MLTPQAMTKVAKMREKLKILAFSVVNSSSCTESLNQSNWARKQQQKVYKLEKKPSPSNFRQRWCDLTHIDSLKESIKSYGYYPKKS